MSEKSDFMEVQLSRTHLSYAADYTIIKYTFMTSLNYWKTAAIRLIFEIKAVRSEERGKCYLLEQGVLSR